MINYFDKIKTFWMKIHILSFTLIILYLVIDCHFILDSTANSTQSNPLSLSINGPPLSFHLFPPSPPLLFAFSCFLAPKWCLGYEVRALLAKERKQNRDLTRPLLQFHPRQGRKKKRFDPPPLWRKKKKNQLIPRDRKNSES